MTELTPVHVAVLAVLVLLLLGLAAVNLMVNSQGSTGYISGGVVESSADENKNLACELTDDSADARRLPIP